MTATTSTGRRHGLASAGEKEFAALEAQLAGTHAGRIEIARHALTWADETFGTGLTVASSMGDEVLVHLVGTTLTGADVFFLDTGYHFAETLGTRDAYAAMLPIRLRTIHPRLTVAEQDAEHGPQLYARDPHLCCAMRKVEPLERALSDRDAWVTGMRREDAPTRTDITVVGWDERRRMVKLNPLAAWTSADVDRYAAEHEVFLNPLRQSGYASIGCAPCTRPVSEGEDPRAGRWAGQDKVECGLHT